jgi:hypothetical protein
VFSVVVNEPFKDHLRELYNEYLLGGAMLWSGWKIEKPLLCQWIIKAWHNISAEVT